ncbi:MAG: hypothetical protein KKG10_12580, partial [Proteobacteria bacterium]|nr:hypothetical protein [Pseudomonadota bacterium]
MKTTIEDHFRDNYYTFFEKYLTSVKKIGGDEYQALCCFHEDSNPSLNFNNQKGTYFCHGCGKKGHIFHFYAKLNGLDTRRDFPKILKGIAGDFGIPWENNGNGAQKPKWNKWPSMDHLKTVYDFKDEKGKYLFSVLRFEPPGEDKTFRQGQKNGKDWIRDIQGVRRVLYRLPDIGKAHEIIIVEGEKDSDTLAGMGFTGTTSPMGAKKWREEYNEALKGKDVVLIPDNDQEGREHMAQVGASLKGIAKSLKWIDLPDLPNKGDITNWVEKIGDKIE